eukprot:XP_008180542.1 PREDICTED: uncharacterized protein LOC100570392 [Acyrthosiphon pisum]
MANAIWTTTVVVDLKQLTKEGTRVGIFTFFMMLSVVVVYLEWSKIDHQRRLEFWKEINSFKCENDGVRMYSKEHGISCWCPPNYVGEHCQKRVTFMSSIKSMFRFGNSEVSKGTPTMWWSIFPFTSGYKLKTIYDYANLWTNIVSYVSAIKGTRVGIFTFFMMLSVVVVYLEWSKIEKRVSFMSSIKSMFRFGNSEVSKGTPTMWWSIFPFTSGYKLKTIYDFYQNSVKRLEKVFDGSNNGGYGPRILPPANPLERYANDKILPPMESHYNKIVKRKPGQFIPDLTMTASQLYGTDDKSDRSMRSFSCGKTSANNYKHFVTNHAFAQYSDVYLKASIKDICINRSWPSRMITRLFERAKILSTSTTLYVMSLLGVREHNRLSQKWPMRTQDELYSKARKIVVGQTMLTGILDVELRPEVYHHGMEYNRGSRKPLELYLKMTVSNMPENLQYSSTNLTLYCSNSRSA